MRTNKNSLNKIAIVLCIVSLVIGVSAISPVTADEPFFGRIIYVDDDNVEGPWDGTKDHPYQHVQDGIDAASIGDTVYVYNGAYYENVLVYKSITLVGEDRNNTVIDGGGNGDVVVITADGVNVHGFTIQNGGKKTSENPSDSSVAGIKISSYKNTISSNIIKDNKGMGIAFAFNGDLRGLNNSIENNIIENNKGVGIHDTTIARSPPHFLCIAGNIIRGNEGGIKVCGRGVISNNIVYDKELGLILYCDYSEISGNIIYNNDKDPRFGLALSVIGDHNKIFNNHLKDNKGDGLSIAGTNNMIFDNHIENNDIGIDIHIFHSAYYNKIYSNNIISNNKLEARFHIVPTSWLNLGYNIWRENYWGELQLPVKIIPGIIEIRRTIPWIEIDWAPAQEPYELP